MKQAVLVRFGEIFLKGKNKHVFEKLLVKNINHSLLGFNAIVTKISGRYIVSGYDEQHQTEVLEKVSRVFGVYSVSPCTIIETSEPNIENYFKTFKLYANTFKVAVKRADKNFPIQSTRYAAILGGYILNANSNIKVNVVNPETTVFVEIREDKNTYIYEKIIKGVGGMPVGSSSGGLLLLSGGIDSPVAGYLISKRGMPIHAIHFHSFPYTSQQAKDKVLTLAKIISEYCGNIVVHIVPFTKIQEKIHKHCKPEYMITLMRRFMMRISEQVAQKYDLKAIITGESLAQVASQTIESMTSTNAVIKNVPVLRPLVAMDKEDIIIIAKKINTFQTSILPYEDCCTVFLPDNPLIKPKLDKVEKEESRLNVDELVSEAIEGIEKVNTSQL